MRRNRSALPQRSRERIWWIVGVFGVAEELRLLLAPPPPPSHLQKRMNSVEFLCTF